MKSFGNPFEDNFDQSEHPLEDKDSLDNEYANKAIARLDEMFKQQDLAEAQISYGYKNIESESKEQAETDPTLRNQEKVFEETIKALRDQGINPLDPDTPESNV